LNANGFLKRERRWWTGEEPHPVCVPREPCQLSPISPATEPGASAGGESSLRPGPAWRALVEAEQVRLLYASATTLLINPVVGLIAAAVFWPVFAAGDIAAWLLVLTLVIAARMVLLRSYRRRPRAAADAPRYAYLFAVGAFATGCVWGLLAAVVFTPADAAYTVFAAFVLGGLCAGAATRDSEYLPAFYGFITPAALPITVVLLIKGGFVAVGMGLMVSAFVAVLALMAHVNHRRITQNIRLLLEQGALNGELHALAAELRRAETKALEGEATFRALAENGVAGIAIVTDDGRLAYQNPRLRAMLGADPSEDMVGSSVFEMIAEAEQPLVAEAMAKLLAGAPSVEVAVTLLTRRGGTLSVLVQSSLTTFKGRRSFIAVALDITERRAAEKRLELANALLATIMETSPDAIVVVDDHAKIIKFNRHFTTMWRLPAEMTAAGDHAPVLAAAVAQMRDPEGFMARTRHFYAHPEEAGRDEMETLDGRFMDRHTAPLWTSDRQYIGRVWFFRDVTDRRRAENEVRHTARHDVLTGLANRRVFMESVEEAIARTQRGGKGFAVLYLDLDHFKDVNDTVGHPMGDRLLCQVADRLRLGVRKTDLVARFGGDEFAVIASEIDDPAEAANLAEKLVAAIADPFDIDGSELRSGVSIGIAVHDNGGDAELLLSHADVALYRAKAEGRGGYRFFTDAMDSEVRTRVALSTELRDGLASGQFFLLYQPQVDSATGRIIGVEALVRWRHPTRGLLSPGDFVPVAERTGLIIALDRWTKREACSQGKAWLEAGFPPMVIAVNVSGMQFKRATEFEKDVAIGLAASQLPPHLLEIEVTETVLMEMSQKNNDVLVRLRASGVRLAIDDFGTGYSSLDYLRKFPVDRLKIAQEFVRDILSDPGSRAIVKATIALGHELGMVVIAEGVETAEQRELLQGWGCTEMQGYYFGRPLAADELSLLLGAGRPRAAAASAA
jgi:diguanylate cyclase (GGDEF)-like protein/PAS domain S-box-containing protein